MIDSSEIVTRIIIALFIIYASIKFIAPIVRLFWEHIFYRPQKTNVNIDVLIERQKQILISGIVKKEPMPLQNQKKVDKTTEAYQKYFQILMENEPKKDEIINDVKKVFSLFDNLQWGEGSQFKNIKKKNQRRFSYLHRTMGNHFDFERYSQT